VFLRFGVHFSGCGLTAFTAYLHVVKEAAENVFAADFGSVSGDGRNFRCCTVGELLRDCDLVSVRAVREKCDEKEQGREMATRVGGWDQGVGGSSGAPSRKARAREGAHPQLFHSMLKDKPPFRWPTRHVEETGRGA